MLTGSLKELLLELKIKEDVDLVGLSPLLVKLNPKNSSEPELLDFSLINNSILVIPPTEDVMVDVWTEPWYGGLPTESVPKLLILMYLETDKTQLADLAHKILSESLDPSESPHLHLVYNP